MKKYWPTAPRDQIANEIWGAFDKYQLWLSSSGYGAMVQELYNAFYQFDNGGFGVKLSKDKRNAKIKVNHYKNLIERLHSMTTQAKLTYAPRARNSDAKSQMQADLSRGLLEFYGDEKNLNKSLSNAVRMALVMLECFILADWDDDAGEDQAPAENSTVRQGDQRYVLHDVFSVARQTRVNNSAFYIVRSFVNRYEEAAKWQAKAELDHEIDPEIYDKILSAGRGIDYTQADRLSTPFETINLDDEDMVEKLTLFHNRTRALPTGRYTEVIGDVVLTDSEMFYKTIPIVRLSCSDILQTVGGDSPATSLLSMQQAIDALYSAVLTNNLNHAKQNIWSPTRLEVHPISEGQNNIVSPQEPKALQLTQSSPETYKLIDTLQTQEQLVSGVNATVRGAPESSTDTAAGQALMLAQAVQFVDDLQRNYSRAAAEVATITIHNLQQFATEERVAYIGGVNRKSYAKAFKSEDIKEVDRVSCEIGNPLTQNISGRYTILKDLLEGGAIKNVDGMNEFLRTGQIDSLTEDTFQKGLLMREENEMIRKGETPVSMISDIHPAHILEHMKVADDPEVRLNPAASAALTAHIQEHLMLQKSMDPDLAAIMGLPPLPSQQMAMAGGMPPPGMGGPPPPEALPGGVSAPNLPPEAPPMAQESYDQYLETAQGPVEGPMPDMPTGE